MFSPQLFKQLNVELAVVRRRWAKLIGEDETYAHVAAYPVIKRIPQEIVRAFDEKRNYVDVCEVSDFFLASTTELFEGERLFFMHTMLLAEPAGGAERGSLVGAAKMVYDHCIEHNLSPEFTNHTVKTVKRDGMTASWTCSTLSIRWNHDDLLATLSAMR